MSVKGNDVTAPCTYGGKTLHKVNYFRLDETEETSHRFLNLIQMFIIFMLISHCRMICMVVVVPVDQTTMACQATTSRPSIHINNRRGPWLRVMVGPLKLHRPLNHREDNT
jgi:hypothetical protein